MDLIITADRIDSSAGRMEAIGMQGGRIVALGDRRDARDWRTAATESLEVGAAAVLPGFIDGHSHPVLGAELTRGVDLGGAANLSELGEALLEAHRALPAGQWLHGWGLRPDVFGGRGPDRLLIDAFVGARPCLLRTFDGHSALAGSAALRAARISGPVRLDGEAMVVCDDNGLPTGYLREPGAIGLVEAVAPAVPFEQRVRALRSALTGMARTGLTSVHSLEFPDDSSALYAAIESEGDLPVRVRCMPWCEADSGPDRWREIAELQALGGRRWHVGGAKLFLDGTIDDGTAWLSAPDARGDSRASVWADPSRHSAAVAYFDAQGIPTATHAIGDAAVRHALTAIEPTTRARHRIEHIEYLSEQDVARFAASCAIASMQPTHCTEYVLPSADDNWSDRLGAPRSARAWPLGDLERAGVPLVLGSDWPIAPYDPRGIIAAAQLRRRAGEPHSWPIAASQAISVQAAVDGFTSRAAESVSESDAGGIAIGMKADLSIFAMDPRLCDLDEFAGSEVIATIVAGGAVHRSTSV